MKEQKIQNLIESYEILKKIYNNSEDQYGAGFADGREQTLQSVIEDLKEILDTE